MNLSFLLTERARSNHPIRVAVIGCGKFATMYLTQARQTAGIHIVGISAVSYTHLTLPTKA